MTTGKNNACRSPVPLLLVLTGIVAVLSTPLFHESSVAWAQQQSAFRLVGTIEGGPFTGAVIDDTKNPQAFYRLNDKLPDESQLVKVLSNHVVLKWPDGTKMELYTTPGAGGGSASVAATAVAPSVAPQRSNPAPERSVDPNRNRAGQDQITGMGEGAADGRPPRVGSQNPNQQNTAVRDPNKRTGVGRKRLGRSSSTEED